MVFANTCFLTSSSEKSHGFTPFQPSTAELSRLRLDGQINMRHPLVRPTVLIDWTERGRTSAVSFTSPSGSSGLATQPAGTVSCAKRACNR